MIIRCLSKFAIFYTLFTINYCFRFVTFWYTKVTKRNFVTIKRHHHAPQIAYNNSLSPCFHFSQLYPQIHPFDRFCLFWAFLFNKYFPPALLLLLHFPTLAAPAIFAPFPSIWWHFSPCPVLAPVQKFNAIKQSPFRFRCKLPTFTDFVDLLRGGIVARLWEIVEIWGVSVRNRAYSSIEPCLKSVLCHP